MHSVTWNNVFVQTQILEIMLKIHLWLRKKLGPFFGSSGNNDSSTAVVRKKVVFCGDVSTGKKSIQLTLQYSEFPTFYPCVVENYSFDVPNFKLKLENRETGKKFKTFDVKLCLWNTPGSEQYDRLRPLSYLNADLFILTFDISCPDSLENISERWIPEIRCHCSTTPFLLVGTKTDLRDDKETINQLKKDDKQPISKKEGEKIAKKIGAIGYVECSALKQEGLDELVQEACRASFYYQKENGKYRLRSEGIKLK